MKKKAKKIFFISPVRLATPELVERTKQYVEKLEKEGHKVHWPIRDTNQVDPTLGINICDTNLSKIREYDEIHVWYMRESTGIHFDLGATYMLLFLGHGKELIFVNGGQKDFEEEFVGNYYKLREILEADQINVWYSKEDPAVHFTLGAIYILIRILNYKKKVVFTNKFEFAKEIAEKNVKAFFQVLNFLDENTREVKNERI